MFAFEVIFLKVREPDDVCVLRQAASTHVKATSAVALARALQLQSTLDSAFPSFVRTLLRSHCHERYQMAIPADFGSKFLPQHNADLTRPKENTDLTIEDQDGKCFKIKYWFVSGLLGIDGWRQFCHAHQLDKGDAVVFQLAEPFKLKVYIVKRDDVNEVDVTDPDDEQVDVDVENWGPEETEQPKSPPSSYVRTKKQKKLPEHTSEQSGHQGSKSISTTPNVQFEGIKSFGEFKILGNGKEMDSEFPEDIRRKYYELCLSEGAFLHADIVQGLSDQSIVRHISETVSVADAMRASQLGTARVTAWDRTLKALEIVGMNVGFLRGRVKRLMSLKFDSEEAEQKYRETQEERARMEEEIRKMMARLNEMKKGKEKLTADSESLKLELEALVVRYQEEAAGEPYL